MTAYHDIMAQVCDIGSAQSFFRQTMVQVFDEERGELAYLSGGQLDIAVHEFFDRYIGPIAQARREALTDLLSLPSGRCDDGKLVGAIVVPVLHALCAPDASRVLFCYQACQHLDCATPPSCRWTEDLLAVLDWHRDSVPPSIRETRVALLDRMLGMALVRHVKREQVPLDVIHYPRISATLRDLVQAWLSFVA